MFADVEIAVKSLVGSEASIPHWSPAGQIQKCLGEKPGPSLSKHGNNMNMCLSLQPIPSIALVGSSQATDKPERDAVMMLLGTVALMTDLGIKPASALHWLQISSLFFVSQKLPINTGHDLHDPRITIQGFPHQTSSQINTEPADWGT